jgi:dihydrofolate reductase
MTRRNVFSVNASADGFFEGPDGDTSWHRVDEELHQHVNDHLRPTSAFISASIEGRVTYELVEAFWPTADEDPQNPQTVREFAGFWREVPKVVHSRFLTEAGPGARIEREVDPEAVRAWKQEPGGDMVLGAPTSRPRSCGTGWSTSSGSTCSRWWLGRGRRLFADDAAVGLDLLESRAFGNGTVLLRCATGQRV